MSDKPPSKKSLEEAKYVVSRWSKDELPVKVAQLLDKAFSEGWEACELSSRLSKLTRGNITNQSSQT